MPDAAICPLPKPPCARSWKSIPTTLRHRVNLARLYVQMAQAEYEKALKDQPDNAMIARKLEALKAMQ